MTSTEAIEIRAAEWLIVRDRGDWSASDQAAFDAWLDASVAHRVAYLRIEAAWERADAALGAEEPRSRTPWLRRFALPASLAASIVLAVGSGLLWIDRPADVHTTAVGQRDEVRLKDGSTLALNTNTRLVAVVEPTSREVWLDRGEAYFEIAHDPRHPFVVHAGKQVITVLGTKFLVRQDGDRFRLAVTEGRVRLSSVTRTGDRPIVLTRGEIATATANNVLVSSEGPGELADETAWRTGSVLFDRVTLGEAVEELNRYSERKFAIADPKVAAIRIGGRFATGDSDGFAYLLRRSLKLRVDRSANGYAVSR